MKTGFFRKAHARLCDISKDRNDTLVHFCDNFIVTLVCVEDLPDSFKSCFFLIRADDEKAAFERIREILHAYQSDDKVIAEMHKRVIPVLGDVTEPRMGLTEEASLHLAKNIDLVIHAAGKVSLHGV